MKYLRFFLSWFFAVNLGLLTLAFFLMGSFFLIYVPFSKISHYLYYPFTRYYLGKTFARRGVFPIKRVPSDV